MPFRTTVATCSRWWTLVATAGIACIPNDDRFSLFGCVGFSLLICVGVGLYCVGHLTIASHSLIPFWYSMCPVWSISRLYLLRSFQH